MTSLGGVDAAVGNYCAVAATDTSDPTDAPWKTTANWENGALVSACWKTANSQTAATEVGACKDKGIGLRQLGDGISRTIIACESRELVYNAWISGASTWVVATTPNSLAADKVAVGKGKDEFIAVIGGGKKGEGLALNFGTDAADAPAAKKYFQAADWATAADRAWGPSSEHANNVVMHVWADAHATPINRDIDPTVYLHLITRAGADPGTEKDLIKR
jgi:hypothetical protein